MSLRSLSSRRPVLHAAVAIALAVCTVHSVASARVTLVKTVAGPRSQSSAAVAAERVRSDDPVIRFAPLPDSLTAFRVHRQKFYFTIGSYSLLWFEIRWRLADGTDVLVNAGYYDADDSVTLPYNVPSAHDQGSRFRVYLRTELDGGTVVYFHETPVIPIRPQHLQFSLSAEPSRAKAAVGDSLSIAVSVRWTPDSGEVFPYLFCDLGSDEAPMYARAVGYDVRDGVSHFVFPFHITERAAGRAMRARCYLSDGFLPEGPILAEVSSAAIDIARLDSGGGSHQRLALGRGGWYLDRKPLFLFGTNLVTTWLNWDSATIVREIGRMSDHHLNYVRLWFNWMLYEPSPGVFAEAVKQKLRLFLREADRRGIFVEPVPVAISGGWIFDLYREHWWSDSTMRAAQYRYFYDVARTILEAGVRNVAYISVMQEGSASADWYDPLEKPRGFRTYPGPLDSAEALADWRAWLRANGRPDNWTWDSSAVEFSRWASERFNDLIALRRKAVRDASGYEFRFGLEGGQGGYDFDRRIVYPGAPYYLKPERWCHLVDVAEIHNYVPSDFSKYLSYELAIRAYVRYMRRFDVVANVGEFGFDWVAPNYDSLPWAWEKLRTKSGKLRDLEVAGCALWCWSDYDERHFGLEDISLRPRSILDSLGEWLGVWMPDYLRDRTTSAIWNYGWRSVNPRVETGGIIAATSLDQYASDSSRYRRLSLPLFFTHCRDDITEIVVSGTYDSTLAEFAGLSPSGEFPDEPVGLAAGWEATTSVTPDTGTLKRFAVRLAGTVALSFPVSTSAGCSLDTLPLVYLTFTVLRKAPSAGIIVALDSGSGVYARSAARRFAIRMGGADSLAAGASPIDGAGRTALRIYDRPSVRPTADSAFAEIGRGRYRLRDTVVFHRGDTVSRFLDVSLRDTVRGSIVPHLFPSIDRQWASLASPLPLGYPSWLRQAPRDLSLTVLLDPAAAAGDTGEIQLQVGLGSPELRHDVVISVPVRWIGPTSVSDDMTTSPMDVAIAPNPARPGTLIRVVSEGMAARTRRVWYVACDGRRIPAMLDARGLAAAPGMSGVYLVCVDLSGTLRVGRLVVVP